jgi:type IV pilus assembly protein PilQ
VPLEKALDIVLASGGYSWVKLDGYYLVGLAEPSNPNFPRFAVTEFIPTKYITADKLVNMLPQFYRTYVQGERDSNVVVASAPQHIVDAVKADIARLDVRPRQVMIEALVTEVKQDKYSEYNLKFMWRKFGGNTGLGDLHYSSGGAGELVYSDISAQDAATLRAIIDSGHAKILANPRVATVEGKEAVINVGREGYYTIVSGPVNFPYTTVQKITTGISLKVTPRIADNGEILVDLAPEVSYVVGVGQQGLPENTVRKVSSTLCIRDGDTIVIGGLTEDSDTSRESKIPLLGDLPLIGKLFRSTKHQVVRNEVVIMITPRILQSPAESVAAPEIERLDPGADYGDSP